MKQIKEGAEEVRGNGAALLLRDEQSRRAKEKVSIYYLKHFISTLIGY